MKVMTDELEILKQYVKTSRYRYNVLCVLETDILKIPTQISIESGIRKNHISKVLRELKEHGLIECINEYSKKGRLYRLTSIGKQIKESLSYTTGRYIIRDGLIYDSLSNTYYNIDDAIDLLNMKQ